ncbi:hypothetical protein BOTBODRAFT_176755 [Botryobasidium botryosum FD-172 SS1]|uniref:Uncharacterized protein n=1 Tax=Botryobasidium botryosum (strain FD-172 SS1) TaxID=930990 RepID=A0A067MK88_BOTB1|nr:hypothetical protein BOTBODRAFT_176755 [Botryobasidium botryosum FD-172 SS1]
MNQQYSTAGKSSLASSGRLPSKAPSPKESYNNHSPITFPQRRASDTLQVPKRSSRVSSDGGQRPPSRSTMASSAELSSFRDADRDSISECWESIDPHEYQEHLDVPICIYSPTRTTAPPQNGSLRLRTNRSHAPPEWRFGKVLDESYHPYAPLPNEEQPRSRTSMKRAVASVNQFRRQPKVAKLFRFPTIEWD